MYVVVFAHQCCASFSSVAGVFVRVRPPLARDIVLRSCGLQPADIVPEPGRDFGARSSVAIH